MPPDKRPLLIGITGSIGSGKTTVCRILEQHYPVYFTDEMAHAQLFTAEVREILVARWGTEICQKMNIDRAQVARIVFNNPAELKFLDSVVHPLVLQQMQKLADSARWPVICFEVPLLFETNLEKCFDHILTVTAEEKLRIVRLQNRNSSSESDIRHRITTQLNDTEKISRSDTVFFNNGSLADLKRQVEDFIKKIKEIPRRELVSFTDIST
jgi:dephospho-CoA kinase